MGLSYFHKVPQDHRSPVKKQPARFIAYTGASYVKANREYFVNKNSLPDLTEKIVQTADGEKRLLLLPEDEDESKKRGRVVRFSFKSRRRMFDRINMVHRDSLPSAFVTLTYPSEYPEKWADYKRHLRIFSKRFARAFPDGSFLWRLEFQKRGAPHYHLLVWGGPELRRCEKYAPEEKCGKCWGCKRGWGCWPKGCKQCEACKHNHRVRMWFSRAWYEVCDTGDEKHLLAGTQVAKPKSWDNVKAYVGKMSKVPETKVLAGEIGKTDQALAEGVGRWWGIYRRNNWKQLLGVMIEREIPDPLAERLIAHWAAIIDLMASMPDFLPIGLTYYGDADYWLGLVDRLVERPPPETLAVYDMAKEVRKWLEYRGGRMVIDLQRKKVSFRQELEWFRQFPPDMMERKRTELREIIDGLVRYYQDQGFEVV